MGHPPCSAAAPQQRCALPPLRPGALRPGTHGSQGVHSLACQPGSLASCCRPIVVWFEAKTLKTLLRGHNHKPDSQSCWPPIASAGPPCLHLPPSLYLSRPPPLYLSTLQAGL
jgi:hypothetical protein